MQATAYEFLSDRSLEELADALTARGPWAWSLRESHWYGDYINCRPVASVRIRIHDPAQFNRSEAPHFVNSTPAVPAAGIPPSAGTESGPSPAGLRRYKSQVDVQEPIDRTPFDSTFLDLLTWLNVRELQSIPPYD